MPNKKRTKIPLNAERLHEVLSFRGLSVRSLGNDIANFGWSSKTVERGLKSGEISPELMEALAVYLDIDPNYLSGKYHEPIDQFDDEQMRATLYAQLEPKKFPYLIKQQGKQADGRFLYDHYLENVLAIHDISMRQFYALSPERQKLLQLDIEDALIHVIGNYFDRDAFGRKDLPNIQYYYALIDSYDPDEPDA